MQRLLDLLLTTDPRVRAGLVTTGLACLLMAFCILAIQMAAAAGMGDAQLVHWWSVGSAACVLTSFALIRSRYTRHWRDPAFTAWQLGYAIISNAVAYVITGPARGIEPPILAIAMMFGVFSLTPRQAKTLLLFGLACFAVAGATAQWGRPHDAPPPMLGAVYMLIVATVLFTSTALTLHAHALREGLKRHRRELAQAVEHIQALATRDELTGLPNRRYMLEVMRLEGLSVQRSSQPMLMALLDLDHFKAVNDTHGHAAGDLALQTFARTVMASVRGTDILARWGGEEFVLLMGNTQTEEGTQVLERVRAAVATTPVALPEGSTVLRLTVSVGAAQLRAGETPTALLQRADEALYEAKRLGRNRVAWAEQENPAQNAPEIRAACA